MKTLVVLPLLAVTSAVYAQKSGDWKPSAVKPITMAKNLDSHLFSLKNALGRCYYRSEMVNGKGSAILEMKIRNKSMFRIDMVRNDPKSENPFESQLLIGNKGQLYLLSKSLGLKKLAMGVDPGFGSSQGLVKAWPLHMQQLAFLPYITGKGIYTPLIQGLLRGEGGYSIRMDERSLQAQGHNYPQLRIFASRPPAVAKKLGQSSIEIVVDAITWLPLQIRVIERHPNQPQSLVEWTTSWKGPEYYDDKIFGTPSYQKIPIPGVKKGA